MEKTREYYENKWEELRAKQEKALEENAPRDRLIVISNAMLEVEYQLKRLSNGN